MYHQPEEIVGEEKSLIVALNSGDQQAFEKLYHLYSVRILKRLVFLLKDVEIAKEILQDVFLTVWEKRETLDAERSFRSLLFRIAENKVVDFFRKAANERKLQEHIIHLSTQSYFHTEDSLAIKEADSILQQAINSLSAKRKEIFILCRLEGKTYEEAGKILGISAGTVNDHMVKALRIIRNQVNVLKTLPLPIILSILSQH